MTEPQGYHTDASRRRRFELGFEFQTGTCCLCGCHSIVREVVEGRTTLEDSTGLTATTGMIWLSKNNCKCYFILGTLRLP